MPRYNQRRKTPLNEESDPASFRREFARSEEFRDRRRLLKSPIPDIDKYAEIASSGGLTLGQIIQEITEHKKELLEVLGIPEEEFAKRVAFIVRFYTGGEQPAPWKESAARKEKSAPNSVTAEAHMPGSLPAQGNELAAASAARARMLRDIGIRLEKEYEIKKAIADEAAEALARNLLVQGLGEAEISCRTNIPIDKVARLARESGKPEESIA